MRVEQPEGERGSLKWIQQAIEQHWASLEQPILARISKATCIDWCSPIRTDGFAEYRDRAFLERLDLARLQPGLASFWPVRGPQWDALGRCDSGAVLIVEAKAHIDEFCSPASAAGSASRAVISRSLKATATALGSACGTRWVELFYQYANRLAHLWFLRSNGVDAYLVLVGFVGDTEVNGPSTAEAWTVAYKLADHALGLPARHMLTPFIIHVSPEVPT